MADSPQKTAVESGSACRNRLLDESRSALPDSGLQQQSTLKELCRLGFPNFELTQNSVADNSSGRKNTDDLDLAANKPVAGHDKTTD